MRRSLLDEAKAVPCADCKRRFNPWQMQFDHRPGEKKLFNLSDAGRDGVGLARIRREIAKCDIVCANCHADRTYWRAHAEEDREDDAGGPEGRRTLVSVRVG